MTSHNHFYEITGALKLRRFLLFATAALCIAGWTSIVSAEDAVVAPKAQSVPGGAIWNDEVLDVFRSLPVLDDGRVKPLDTYAGFKLLKFNGRRSCATPDGRKLTPIEWLLDVLYRPELARDYAMFSVDSSDVVISIGLTPHEKKRDRYSYKELAPGRDKMMELAGVYARIPDKDRGVVQTQILNLAHNFVEFEELVDYAAFARKPFSLEQCDVWTRLFPGTSEASLFDALKNAGVLYNEYIVLKRDKREPDETRSKNLEVVTKLLSDLDEFRKTSTALALFPPSDPNSKDWLTPADIISKAFEPGAPVKDEIGMLGHFEALGKNLASPGKLNEEARALGATITQLAEKRGEYSKVPLEVSFYKAKFFMRSLVFYIIAFLLVAIAWVVPNNRWLARVNLAAIALPTLLLGIGIAYRCVIRGRPPVTTLYETILFTTFVTVIVCMFMEIIGRRGVAISMGAALGVIGMFLANKYEAAEGSDTMPSMVAVLDTNFWLATHVTTISIGYAAGLLSGAVAHVYIFGKLFGLKKDQPSFYDYLQRMVYGVFAFGFFFSFVGTLLGGVWADQSWGRFWGWDPKENGALLICLWQLATLHARLGGYIRDLGFNIAAVVCGMVVAFSWWGVNLLGVGLHTYGFTSGAMTSLAVFWTLEFIVVAAGFVVWAKVRKASSGA
jgi:ABC-type transport system involved in cytochrome c biogenesis permease subunit